MVVTSGRIRWRGPAFPGDGNGQVRPGPDLPWETGGEGSRQALRPGTTLLVAYDIPSEGVRRRVADVCKDYGLVRMQLSVFVGELETRYHEEVRAKLARRMAGREGRVDCFVICGADMPRRVTITGETDPAGAPSARRVPVPGSARPRIQWW